MKRVMIVAAMACLAWMTPAVAMAEEESTEKTGFAGVGLNLRTDLGVHPLRLDVAWRMPGFEALLVLDPMFLTDGQSSTDLIGYWLIDDVHPYAGWRLTTIGLVDGAQLQHNLLVGVGLALPEFWDGLLRGQWGFELATTIVKHGGGLPAEVVSFGSARSYLDLVNFAMYARFDFQIGVF